MALRVLGLAVATLVVAAPGSAAAVWSPPTTVGPAAAAVIAPGIAFGGSAGPLLSAGFRAPGGSSAGRRVSRLFAGTTETARLRLIAAPEAYGAARAAFLRQSPRDRDVATTITLGVSLGDVAGHPGSFRLLSRQATPDSAAIAANDAGVVAVAWTEATNGVGGRVRLAIRPAGGRFSPAVTVASGAVGRPTGGTASGAGLAVAVGGRGDVVVAYQREVGRTRTIEARLRPAGGRLGRPQALGPQRGLVDISAAMAPGGRAVVVWDSQDVGEEANDGYQVYAAIRAAGSPRFGRAQLLDPGGPAIRSPGRAVLGMGRDGSAVVAWSSPYGTYAAGVHSAVRVATAGPRGRFGAQRALAPSGAVGDVAIGRDGAAAIVWSQLVPEEEPADVVAAVRPAGARDFAAPEAVSPVERAHDPAVAFDPRTGTPVVVWSALTAAGTGEMLRVAQRSG